MYSEGLLTGHNLSLSDALLTGGETTFIGLAIVFAVLIILMIVLMLFKVIFYKEPAKKAVQTVTANEVPVSEENNTADEEELVAVLTAAVAASLNTSTYNLRIKSYRRTENKMPAWNKAGVTETINNRF